MDNYTDYIATYLCKWLTLHEFIIAFPTSLSTPICKISHLSVSKLKTKAKANLEFLKFIIARSNF